MKTSNRITQHLTPLAGLVSAWGKRTPRERRLLIAMLLFLIGTFMYFVAYQPAQTTRQKWLQDLPVLRNELAQMTQLIEQQKIQPTRNNTPTTQTALDAALPPLLMRAQLDRNKIAMQWTSPQELRISIRDSNYRMTMNALAEITQSFNLTVIGLTLSATEPFTQGQANLTLDWRLP